MVLRLAEHFLIRAEARAQQGNTTGAISDSSVIRNRAGLGNDGAKDFTIRMKQFFDYYLKGALPPVWMTKGVPASQKGDIGGLILSAQVAVDSVMGGSTGVCQAKGGTWNSNQQLYPLPQCERNVDVNLVTKYWVFTCL